MTNTKTLKHYLLEKENAYLLNDDNNGKTIMVSGAWGSGKTHFWQNEIEPKLKEKLNDKACVYVSLYGKESLSDIKSDVYLSASGKNMLSTEVATFGMEALSAIKDSELAVGKLVKAGKELRESHKKQKGISKLKKGGVVCFDDFERKSKNVDLNDLFGFISQLALNLECKVVIILNSDVFQGEEADIFSRVKEKTINKYLHFNPSIEELFTSIASHDKYSKLESFKTVILEAIKDTGELNARIYTQVLDNCLEWVSVSINYKEFKLLTLMTMYFIESHRILSYTSIDCDYYAGNEPYYSLNYFGLDEFPSEVLLIIKRVTTINDLIEEENCENKKVKTTKEYIKVLRNWTCRFLIDKITTKLTEKVEGGELIYTETEQKMYLDWVQQNRRLLCSFWKYGYQLFAMEDIEEDIYNKMADFVRTGILLP